MKTQKLSKTCKFCQQLQKPSPQVFLKSLTGLFVAKWDYQPDVPGHALVIPTRHVVTFNELTNEELSAIASFVEEVKEYIAVVDLKEMYAETFATFENDLSRQRVETVLEILEEIGSPAGRPQGYNDAINDGAAAGQSIHHLHWHVKPRWYGDSLPLDE